MKILNFTHYDLDGCLSSLFVKTSLKDTSGLSIYSTGYYGIDNKISKLDRELSETDLILVTDLNITQEQYNSLAKYNKDMILIDHHETANLTVNDRTKYFMNTEMSACKAVYSLFKSYKTPAICDLGDIYDMWHIESPKWSNSRSLNDLFWYYGFDTFISIYEHQQEIFTDEQLTIIEQINDNIDRYMDEVKNSYSAILGDTFFVYHPKFEHISYISLYFKDYPYYVIMKSKNECAIRTSNPDFNFGVFMEKCKGKVDFVNIGGHTKVGGFILKDETMASDIEKVVEILNNY